jgi:predicted AAA+ superfamily ATPase
MAITNHERVGKVLDLLREGLKPFVEREMRTQHSQLWFDVAKKSVSDVQSNLFGTEEKPTWDIAVLLAIMWNQWTVVFAKTLGRAERSLISELRDQRNKWAHQQTFSTDDTYRVLDSAYRLLTAVSAKEADEIEKMKMELLRVRFDDQVRTEKRKSVGTAIETIGTHNLKPWREVVTPHKDVASGRYQQAEFAADLWQVHLGEGSEEYKNPVEFFRRTYLTESLKQLLVGGLRRLSGNGGDPVIQLQTNFGGGKTHSMMALYHLFSGAQFKDLLGMDDVLKEAEVDKPITATRVVLVGNKISPGNPSTKADGTVVRTLWGELAWQLGGRKAFDRIRKDDENSTSPGDVLRELFNEYGPCLILIDEWVAYARQLHDQNDLPGGSFETHFSFVQALTESAKLAKKCLLVVSLPASDTTGSPHAVADDVEVGGERGRIALARLRNAVGRVEASWRPASAEEGFEIVRRRLFEPIVDQTQFVARDTVAQAFFDLYNKEQQEFPPECHAGDYQRRLKAAYPIHPELFDRLYTDWSTLVKFQRTRGVLRLMAAVIHSLWEKGDKNPMILPSNVSIDDPRVQSELTRYLSDNWAPVIEKDVDGPNALPLKIDGEVPNLGKFAACRRVARTIYMGSAPTATAAHTGIEDRRVKLGCVMPGENPAMFGDALRRLSAAATYLYADGNRYWYSTQPTVTKIAEDKAEQFKRNKDAIERELDKRLREDLRKIGDFARVHPLPQSSQDIPDDTDSRLVVLGSDFPYSKAENNRAEEQAKIILETRGNSPRLFRNTLVFLAVDQVRLQDLEEAICRFLAWESILAESETLGLTPYQVKQAETQKASANSAVMVRIPEAYQWLLVPEQTKPQDTIKWNAIRLTGPDLLAIRASKKLKNDDLLVTALAGTRLRMELDKVPLWRGDFVTTRQLAEDFARYLYLPRLSHTSVLYDSVTNGLNLTTWEQETFAYADSWDETNSRFNGLRCGENVFLSSGDTGLLVKADVAVKQVEQQKAKVRAQYAADVTNPVSSGNGSNTKVGTDNSAKTVVAPTPRRFHGTIELDPARVGRDAGRVADEVIAHLSGLMGSKLKVTLEIEAEIPNGTPDNVVRIVTENSRTLKFKDHGFEKE